MPTLDTYITQGRVSPTTGTPEIPQALASQEALTSGAAQASGSFAHLTAIGARVAHAQAVAEQTTRGAEILNNLDRQTRDFATGLSRPYDPTTGEGVNSTPQDKKAYFNQRVGEFAEEAQKNAAKVGGIAQDYVATHLRTVVDPHLQTFSKSMDTLRQEMGQLDLLHSIQSDVDRAIDIGATPAEQQQLRTNIYQRLLVGVNAKFLSGEQAAIFANSESKRFLLESNITAVTKDPVAAIMAMDNGTSIIPRSVQKQAREAAVHSLSFQQGQQDRMRQETKRLLDETQEKNLLKGEVGVTNGSIFNETHLLKYNDANTLSASGFHTLQVMLKNKQQGMPSDPTTLATMYKRLSSLDPKDWPSRDEVQHLMDPTFGPPKLSAEHGVGLFNHIRSYSDEVRKEGITNYRQAGMDAQDQIKAVFRGFTGGVMDFDKGAALVEAQVLRDFSEDWQKGKDTPGAPPPQSLIDKHLNPAIVHLGRQEKILWEDSPLRKSLPVGTDTLEKVLELRRKGEISPQQAETAAARMRLRDTLEFLATLKKPTTSSSESSGGTVGGVQRNR